MALDSELGHFQTTSVAMDTPTDTGAAFAWKHAAPEGSGRVPGPPPELARDPADRQLKGSEDANGICLDSAEDDSVPMPPPSPPAAPAPPPLSEPGVGISIEPFSNLINASNTNATSSNHPHSSTPSTQQQPAPAVTSAPVADAVIPPQAAAVSSESVLPVTSEAAASLTATSQGADAVLDASELPSSDAAHAAAPAGPVDQAHDQQKGTGHCAITPDYVSKLHTAK